MISNIQDIGAVDAGWCVVEADPFVVRVNIVLGTSYSIPQPTSSVGGVRAILPSFQFWVFTFKFRAWTCEPTAGRLEDWTILVMKRTRSRDWSLLQAAKPFDERGGRQAA
jgi:hypothetical protein